MAAHEIWVMSHLPLLYSYFWWVLEASLNAGAGQSVGLGGGFFGRCLVNALLPAMFLLF
tara:strand:+ start:323 stop:499 length:177 start_codon:yes stop_codon:yes gene_type:complete